MSDSNTSDCSICMENILFNINCIITDCGHCFHASCLLRNIAHNGFNCPCCRNVMADKPVKSAEEQREFVEDMEEYYDNDDNDDTLRGFRFFFNNVYGIPHDEEDIEEEQDAITEAVQIPPLAYICQKLIQDGVTFEQLVKARMYDIDNDSAYDIDQELFEKMQLIITNYVPPVEELQENVVIEEQEQEPAILQPVNVDYSAQSKRSH